MTCDFWKSADHETEECEFYQKIVKCRCPNLPHSPFCKKQHCYICFQKYDHTTYYCPYQLIITKKYFIPKIDVDLIGRFSDCWNPVELLFLARNSSNEILGHLKLQPLEIQTPFAPVNRRNQVPTLYNLPSEFRYRNIGVANGQPHKVLIKNFNIKTDIVEMRYEKLQFGPYFRPLFFTGKILHCSSATILPSPTLPQILSFFPILEKLEIENSNIFITEAWLKDILKYIHGKTLEVIKLIPIGSLDFDIKDLVRVIKEKSKQNVQITLEIINNKLPNSEPTLAETIVTKFSPYFLELFEASHTLKNIPIVSVFAQKSNQSLEFVARFTLKEFENALHSNKQKLM